MEYDETRVYTAKDADKLKVGSKVIVADTLAELKLKLRNIDDILVFNLIGIGSETDEYRFETINDGFNDDVWQLAYLISEPEESKYMSYRQLAEWLAKGNGQSRYKKGSPTTGFMYDYEHENKQLTEDFEIRSWGSDEWIEPTADVYLKDCKQGDINAD